MYSKKQENSENKRLFCTSELTTLLLKSFPRISLQIRAWISFVPVTLVCLYVDSHYYAMHSKNVESTHEWCTVQFSFDALVRSSRADFFRGYCALIEWVRRGCARVWITGLLMCERPSLPSWFVYVAVDPNRTIIFVPKSQDVKQRMQIWRYNFFSAMLLGPGLFWDAFHLTSDPGDSTCH